MPDVVIRLEKHEEEAVRHELAEPYGQELRGGIFEKLRAALDSPPAEEGAAESANEEVDGWREHLLEVKERLEAIGQELHHRALFAQLHTERGRALEDAADYFARQVADLDRKASR